MSTFPGTQSPVPSTDIGGNVVALLIRSALKVKSLLASKRLGPGGAPAVDNPLIPIMDQTILVSVRTQESYGCQADVTQHAVEDGSIYSDHVIIHPLRVELGFEVTNFPRGLAESMLEDLEAAFLARQPIELITEHRIIPDMVMTSYDASNSMPAWGALECRATFTQVRRVSLKVDRFTEEKVSPPAPALTNKLGETDVPNNPALDPRSPAYGSAGLPPIGPDAALGWSMPEGGSVLRAVTPVVEKGRQVLQVPKPPYEFFDDYPSDVP